MTQSRVFLRTSEGELKKIYSIRSHRNKKEELFIQVQAWSTLLCEQYGIPLNAEVHRECPANGIDLHLSIKYEDFGPFSDQNITKVENTLSFYNSRELYKHKQIVHHGRTKLPANISHFRLTEELKMRTQLGYTPDPFNDYIEQTAKHPVYHFASICTPITPISKEKLKSRPSFKGDRTKMPPTENDIVIDESDDPNAHVSICGFLCTPGHYPGKEDFRHKTRVISDPQFPDFGVSVIFG